MEASSKRAAALGGGACSTGAFTLEAGTVGIALLQLMLGMGFGQLRRLLERLRNPQVQRSQL